MDLDAALALWRLGWNIVPAARGGKMPIGPWARWQVERIPERTVRASFRGNRNVFIICGLVSELCVLDCDNEAAVSYWRERLGPVLDDTACVKTSKGWHFYFHLSEARRGRSGDGWDLRADGGGVIGPGSIHESGHGYDWLEGRGPEAICEAPPELWGDSPAASSSGDEGPRSRLSDLLAEVPGEGGRNDWLTRVAGHYAKTYARAKDLYELHVREAAAKTGLPEDEVAKTIASIWKKEQAKEGLEVAEIEEGDEWRAGVAEAAEATGWLVSGGDRILVQTKKKLGDEWVMELAPWLDADLRVTGVMESDHGRFFDVEVRRPDRPPVHDILSAATLADNRQCSIWLANHGVGVGVPDNIFPARMKESTRLLRYLEAQGGVPFEVCTALGWHDASQAFVTMEGIIREDGEAEFEAVRPDPSRRSWMPYRYGFGEEAQARDVLTQVMEFHDETVTAVYGAWWAAVFLKPQIMAAVSQFPFMALEAASESGKTTGYFALMGELAGSTGGQVNPTRAAGRDFLTAHRNGIVWMDDLDSLEAHGELLRNVTVGGSLAKKGEGNHDQVVAKLQAALVISGEGLGLHDQKALTDRAIMLEVPSPVGRVGRNGTPQWDDIVELRSQHPDLTSFAGTLVSLMLRQRERVAELKGLRVGSGRFGDKIAVVRLGARLLAEVVTKGGEDVVARVDAWAAEQDNAGSENTLTQALLPRALRTTGNKRRPEGPDPARRIVATPVWFDEREIVWFSPDLVAEWHRGMNGRISVRTETADALRQQARALGLGNIKGKDKRYFKWATGDGGSIYWKLPAHLSNLVIERSRGEETAGIHPWSQEEVE